MAPYLEIFLPGLFFARLGSMLNEFLADYMAEEKITLPESMTPDLHNRVKYLGYAGYLEIPTELDAFTLKWSKSVSELDNICGWPELSAAIKVVEKALQELGLVGPCPRFALFPVVERTKYYTAVQGPWISTEDDRTSEGELRCESEWTWGRRYSPERLKVEIRIPELANEKYNFDYE